MKIIITIYRAPLPRIHTYSKGRPMYLVTIIQSDLVLNPCFFNQYGLQSEHTYSEPLLPVSVYNDSVIRMFHNPNTF